MKGSGTPVIQTRLAGAIRPTKIVEFWNGGANAGGTHDETTIQFARLIEAEARHG